MKAIPRIISAAGLFVLFSCQPDKTMYDASGTFEATEIIVSSSVNGQIMAFKVREGEKIEKDQWVGYMDSIPFYLKKKQLYQNIKSLESRKPEIDKQIAVIQTQINTQYREKQRVENLIQASAANQKQLDDINAQIAWLETQLEAQKSSLEITWNGIREDISSLEIQIEQLNDQLNKCQIVNPISGTVLVKYAEQSELAIPGKVLYKIADLGNMVFRAYITSDQLTQLQIGQEVKVFADFGEETREYPGRVQWISEKSEFTPKTIQTRDERANLVYAMKISVKNDGFIKIGMYGQVKF